MITTISVLKAGSYPEPLKASKGKPQFKPIRAEAYDAVLTDEGMVYCVTFGRDGSTSCYMIKRISLK